MTERELSKKLQELADRLDSSSDGQYSDADIVFEVSQELRALSNQTYTPGTTSWADLRPQTSKPKKTFTDKTGKRLPF